MAWGTDFTTSIFLKQQVFGSLIELENYIQEQSEDINDIKARLVALVASNPKDIVPEDWKEDVDMYLLNKVKELMEELSSLSLNRFKAELFLDYVKENNVDFKEFNKNL
jgi:hypothetical protein